MHSGCLLQVFFALSSLISSKARDVIGSGPSCLTSSPHGDGLTRVTFLREDAAGVRSLYLTLWSEDMRLVTCEVDTDPVLTEKYRGLCDREDTRGQEIIQRFNISTLLAADAPCALVSSSAPKFTRRTGRDGTEAKARRKRAWIFPGTLWCGTGSKAVGYEQLGMFESTDRCCREHDHCLHIIPALTRNYGVFNPNFFTVSHCDCDQRFRQCLLGVNDTISSMVGYSFFTILQVPCFELKKRRQCTKINWWGMCKKAKKAPYAVYKRPLPFNTTDVTSKYEHSADSSNLSIGEGQNVTKSPVNNPNTKTPKTQHRCCTKDPPRGDTYYHRRTKGKGCKRHQKLCAVAPSQIPSTSRAQNTTYLRETSLFNASKSGTLMPSKKRGKKKCTSTACPTQRSQVPPQVTANSYPQKTSTTQKPTHIYKTLPTAFTAVTNTTKSHKKVPKRGGFRRGDTFQHRCKSCLEQNTTSPVTTVTPSTTTYASTFKVTTLETPRLEKTTETPKPDTWSAATSATPATAELKTAAFIHEDGKTQKQMDSHPLRNNSSQEPMSRTRAPNTHAERGLKINSEFNNVTAHADNELLCRSLKHLDNCKYKIPPLEKTYDLRNMESKTAYHCDCTSRLAAQIESFQQSSVLPTLLMDFVSHYCFKLPKEKKCHIRKSCSGGFTKASDLLRALKKIEEKDTVGVRNSGNDRKRGIPVRLYKRCLRLERKADIMAQLTRL